MTPPSLSRRWDIFCSVVDNYGDVGVAWRLARQLASEHGIGVRLFVDGLDALAKLVPQVDALRGEQSVQGVDVWRWGGAGDDFPLAATESVGDVVVEAFGCGLPRFCLEAMAARSAPPLWINLEYLSAETWTESCHGLASRQPRLPLTRHFYFPGFTPRSGGLLRERDLLARRDAFRADASARAALWRALQVEAPSPGALTVSLFCYPNPGLPALFDAWAASADAIVCMIPEGVAGGALDAWTAGAVRRAGQTLRRGRLALCCVPFVAQVNYDRLLWACDLNFVRGEDSFVRAQWAGRPLVWHCYPQADAAHLAKLDAFLARYSDGLAQGAAAAHGAFARVWNTGGCAAAAWDALASALATLRMHADVWAGALAAQADLASSLVKFAADRV